MTKAIPITASINWSKDTVYFVTRQKDNAAWQPAGEYDIAVSVDPGDIKYEQIILTIDGQSIRLRRIAYYNASQDRTYIFRINNHRLAPDKIAEIFKNRWQIESMFKRLKQNFPLKYFLADFQNAI
ncbi:transposase [Rhodohalobacter sp. 8-1]|uniref:transposase n=1 Tax=Rhodohalobacter sp. 8-1 TaxID=3131972 RepID=UPI0030EB9F25